MAQRANSRGGSVGQRFTFIFPWRVSVLVGALGVPTTPYDVVVVWVMIESSCAWVFALVVLNVEMCVRRNVV